MPAQRSSLRPGNPAFVANLARMAERPVEVRTLEAQVAAESASKADKFAKRGQLLPRERVAPPLDRDSGCLELSALAGLGLHDDDGKKNVMGGGSIVGIGTMAGKQVLSEPGFTILQAARANGVRIPAACESGLCGTCRVMKLSGEVEMNHNGGILDEEIDEGYILACCSRPKGDVEIEA